MEELYFASIIIAFAATTTAFIKFYLKILAELKKPLKTHKNIDVEALNKLREVLSQRRETGLRELLNELRESKSMAEAMILEESRDQESVKSLEDDVAG